RQPPEDLRARRRHLRRDGVRARSGHDRGPAARNRGATRRAGAGTPLDVRDAAQGLSAPAGRGRSPARRGGYGGMPRHRRHGMTVASCRGAPRGTLGATHDSLPTDPVGRRPTGRALCSAAMPVLRLRSIAALGALAAAAAAQDVEVAGTVTDASGQPIAGAEVTFLPLPVAARPRTGSKGRYQIAQAAHRAATRLPRTRTARDGTFRCLVSPQVAALAAGSGVELAMQVQAPGYHTWMRAIGDRLEGASGSVVVLTPARAGRLRVRVATPVEGGCRGFAVIERAFRARPDRTVSLRTVLPLDEHGAVAFD